MAIPPVHVHEPTEDRAQPFLGLSIEQWRLTEGSDFPEDAQELAMQQRQAPPRTVSSHTVARSRSLRWRGKKKVSLQGPSRAAENKRGGTCFSYISKELRVGHVGGWGPHLRYKNRLNSTNEQTGQRASRGVGEAGRRRSRASTACSLTKGKDWERTPSHKSLGGQSPACFQ